MRVAVVGPGRIGGNLARRFAQSGHAVLVCSSRGADAVRPQAEAIGAQAGEVGEAAAFADVVVVATPWRALDDVAGALGDLGGTVLVDTTNQYGPQGVLALDTTAALLNRARFAPGSYAKAFNTLTAAFQAEAASVPAAQRTAMFFVADPPAREPVEALIEAVGFVPVSLGGPERAALLEAPRREGSVYGEAYRPADAERIAAALDAGEDPARLARELKLGA